MDMKVLDKILWWIPSRECRGFIRSYFFTLKNIDSNINYIKNSTEAILGTKFPSQFKQDIEAYIFFKKQNKDFKKLFYVDIGAYDGVVFSNTYAFEQLGSDGVCVEANPRVYNQLKSSRKCSSYNVAITDKTASSVDFVDVENIVVLSGLSNDMSKEHLNRIENENGKINYIKIPTMTFDDLMKNHNGTHIDFLSLDVEGGELTILKSIDFSKYTFSLMTIENNEPDNVLIDFMDKNGYKVYQHIANCDIMFIPK